MSDKWDNRFMDIARMVSTWSKDPDRQVGAVIVSVDKRHLSVGYNGFPRGVQDMPDRLKDKEAKQALTVHAELNAIYNSDFPLAGCKIYVANNFPCHLCAQGIIQVGIVEVIADRRPNLFHKTWGMSWQQATFLMTESKVQWRVLRDAL